MTIDGVFEPYPHQVQIISSDVPEQEFSFLELPPTPPAFVRPKDSPLDCVWCFSDFPWPKLPNAEALVGYNLKPHIWRVLLKEFDGRRHCLLLRRSHGLIFREGESNGANFKRPQRGPMNLWRWLHSSQEDISRWFEEEIKHPDADFHQALDWLDVPATEKTWTKYYWLDGKGTDLETLMMAVMSVFHECFFEHGIKLQSTGSVDSITSAWILSNLDPVERQIRALINTHFSPYLTCRGRPRTVSNRGIHLSQFDVTRRTFRVTAHEKLEAFLRLQTWLESIGEWENIGPLLPR